MPTKLPEIKTEETKRAEAKAEIRAELGNSIRSATDITKQSFLMPVTILKFLWNLGTRR